LTPAALEVLACITFKQPISQGEIDLIFGNVDKRHPLGRAILDGFFLHAAGEAVIGEF
jgi:hypothetical protein